MCRLGAHRRSILSADFDYMYQHRRVFRHKTIFSSRFFVYSITAVLSKFEHKFMLSARAYYAQSCHGICLTVFVETAILLQHR